METTKEYLYIDNDFYKDVKKVLEEARKRIYRNIQSEMVLAYWQIGKMIVEKQGGAGCAKYGDNLIHEFSAKMIKDFGKGYTPRNLWYMKQLYLTFPKVNAVRAELSWTHYRLLFRISKKSLTA